MKTSALILLSATDYGTDNGTYDGSSTSFIGTEQKAAGYYSSAGTKQTVAIFTEDLLATIKIQATVDTTPTETSWFTVLTFEGDGSSVNDTTGKYWNEVHNITGKFTYVRASVSDFTQGVINKVTLSY